MHEWIVEHGEKYTIIYIWHTELQLKSLNILQMLTL